MKSRVKALALEQQIQCSACSNITTVYSSLEDHHKIILPTECKNKTNKIKKRSIFSFFMKKLKEKEGVNINRKQIKQKCNNKKFQAIQGSEHLIDVQEIVIQDCFNDNLHIKSQRTIRVILHGELTNSCKAGDDVSICGILMQRWLKSQNGQRPIIENCIDGQSVIIFKRTTNAEVNFTKVCELPSQLCLSQSEVGQMIFQQKLIRSTCPHIYQRYDLKLALLLSLVGGVSQTVNQTTIRGNSHMLLIGEPGTGKSTILKYVSSIAPKAVYTNGIGSTSAGLTLSYIKEGNDWMIEVNRYILEIQAGALVLADQGVCCIDEFNLIQKAQMDSILEALEQQTVSSSKAGLTARLNARSTVVAACNPVGSGQKYKSHLGKYQQEVDVSTNTGLSTPILSRFDLIFVLIDECNSDNDIENTSFLMEKYMDATRQKVEASAEFSSSDLKSYLGMVRETYMPEVSNETQEILSKYYILLRQKHNNISVRSLESLIRLTQAHARLLQKDQTNQFDAFSVILLVESTGCQGLGFIKEFDSLMNVNEVIAQHEVIKLRLEIE